MMDATAVCVTADAGGHCIGQAVVKVRCTRSSAASGILLPKKRARFA